MSATDTITSSIAQHLRTHHPPHRRPALRDAHPKHHGCVRAVFVVEPDGAALGAVRHGVFARPGRTYEAWVRFSNALKERHDLAPDARGMAVKLMGVEESDSGTQDFLMVSHHTFFAKDAEEFVDFPAAVFDVTFRLRAWLRVIGFFIGLRPRRLRLRGLAALLRSLKFTWSPLVLEYFSQTPYRFGQQKLMKYSVRPHEPRPLARRVATRLRALAYLVASNVGGMKDSHDLLRAALVSRLREGPVIFDFHVQVRDAPTDPNRSAVEDDAVAAWSERDFPSRKVGEIRILPLEPDFDEEVMMSLAQHLSFTPWHTVPDHEPVGSINLARRVVYDRISSLRHELNGKRVREPQADETAASYVASLELRP